MVEELALSMLIGASVGLSAGYLGSIMVLEKMALVGDALSHVALPGLALGLLFNFNPLLGGFAFLFASSVIIWQVGRVTKLSFETIVGATFTLSLAVGILMIQDLEVLEEALFGDIATVTLSDAVAAVVIAVVAIYLTKIVYNKIVLSMISEELAISKGVNVPRVNLLFLLLVSLVVAIGIKITGTLLVGFLVVVPAAAAKNLSANLSQYSVLSSLFGAISASIGILLASLLGYLETPPPPGPLVVVVGVAIFVTTTVVRWRRRMSI
ncbi:MAG TPA: metal ABC transporter permease [Candidatus Bathyarchaeia archaeon]|nr:metal ABC transporter permease [Candidatus Bathyarchaeia archaeon]